FRFFVLLYIEVCVCRCVSDRSCDVVIPKTSFIGNINFAAKGAARGKLQVSLENFSVVRVFYSDFNSISLDHLVSLSTPAPHDAFEIDLLRGAIDGAICVYVPGQIGISALAVIAEVERIKIGNCEVVMV